jgi:hypothetical protein
MAKRILFLLSMAFLGGCTKIKVNNSIPIVDVSNKSASSIRLFNLYDLNLEMAVNNVPLTAFGNTNGQTGNGGTVLGLSLFPNGSWANQVDGAPFYLPSILLDKNGKAEVYTTPSGGGVTIGGTPALMDTTLQDDPAHPTDYYMLNNGHWKPEPRSATPPIDPTHFKIRIINLGAARDTENIVGPVTAVYADGTHIDPRLEGVLTGQTTDYVELPYGSYEIKLFCSQGGAIDVTRQLTRLPGVPNYNPCVVTPQLQEAIFPGVVTFKPGAVYSIVVSQNQYEMFDCSVQFHNPVLMNSYRIITDVDPGTNATYARVQAVNALSGGAVTVTVDGRPLGSALSYIGSTPADVAQHADYFPFVSGSHRVEALDAGGALLASGMLTLYPFDNYTIWVYPMTEGKPALLFVSNDMTGSIYTSNYRPGGSETAIDDGTNGTPHRETYNPALESRFLNLSTDVPYLTFTADGQMLPTMGPQADTLRDPSAYANLMPGVLPVYNPDIIYSVGHYVRFYTASQNGGELGTVPALIRAYQSVPGPLPQLPGTWLPGIPPLDLQKAMVANPALYSAGQAPNAESGVYTMALVGKVSDGSARIVLIKHNN